MNLALGPAEQVKIETELVGQGNKVRDSDKDAFVDGKGKEILNFLEAVIITTSDVEGSKQAGLDEKEIGDIGNETVLQAKVEDRVDLAFRSGENVKVKTKLVSQPNEIGDSNEDAFVDSDGKERLDLLEARIVIIPAGDMDGSEETLLDEGNVGKLLRN